MTRVLSKYSHVLYKFISDNINEVKFLFIIIITEYHHEIAFSINLSVIWQWVSKSRPVNEYKNCRS